MLKVNNLQTGYGKKQILNGISIHVEKGEVVAIIGHNGAGKSTMLKAIFGLLPIGKGEIGLDTKPNSKTKSLLKTWETVVSFVMQGSRSKAQQNLLGFFTFADSFLLNVNK